MKKKNRVEHSTTHPGPSGDEYRAHRQQPGRDAASHPKHLHKNPAPAKYPVSRIALQRFEPMVQFALLEDGPGAQQ